MIEMFASAMLAMMPVASSPEAEGVSSRRQLYLDKGVWNGERILSEDWVDLATAKQTWSGKNQADRPVVEGHIEGLGKSGRFSSTWLK